MSKALNLAYVVVSDAAVTITSCRPGGIASGAGPPASRFPAASPADSTTAAGVRQPPVIAFRIFEDGS
jgi:hypothetical protein